MTTALTVQETLTLANLQMAAEAFLTDKDGQVLTDRRVVQQALVDGNNRASRFTAIQAEDFAATWEVKAQRSTDTGFSGTVFQSRETKELVLCFRSTEFIDDFVRDNKAANELEIFKHGLAFGQLRDMERWFAELNAPGGALAGQGFSVTGYSLGGHLATAFNTMHGGETLPDGTQRVRVVTFNGAGVGTVTAAGGRLSEVVCRFDAWSTHADGQAFRCGDPAVGASVIDEDAHVCALESCA